MWPILWKNDAGKKISISFHHFNPAPSILIDSAMGQICM